MRLLPAVVGALVLAAPPAALARSGRGTSATPGPGGAARGAGAGSSSASCPTGRHSSGRSDEAWEASRRTDFQRRTPCPSTGTTRGPCRGYEIIDVAPAGRGQPWTLRWATPEEAERARDESPWRTR